MGVVHEIRWGQERIKPIEELHDQVPIEDQSDVLSFLIVVLAAAVGWYARSAVLTTRMNEATSEEDAGGRLTLEVPQIPSDARSSDTAADVDATERAAAAIQDEAIIAVGGVEVAPPSPPVVEEEQTPAEEEHPKGVPEPTVDISNVVRTDSGERLAQPVSIPARRAGIETLQARQVPVADAAHAPMASRVAGAGVDAAATWRAVDEAEATNILQRAVPTIEGLEVRGYSASQIVGQRIVRVQHALTTGDIVNLIIIAGASEGLSEAEMKRLVPADVLAEEETGAINTISVVRDDLSIRISAPLTTDSLRALSEKITAH